MKKLYLKEILFITILFFISSFTFAQTEKISLDLKGMDIVEVLKMLAAKGELNVIVGSNVRGKVTMFLKDVDIDDAFDLILVANKLARDERNGIIYVMTERDYEMLYGGKYDDKKEVRIIQLKYAKAVEAAKVLNQIKTKIGRIITDEASNTIVAIDSPEVILQIAQLINQIDKPTQSKIFELDYAAAKDLKDRIQEMLTKGIGAIQIDERTNKIVVTDLEDNLKKIEEVIEAFDARPQQVLIEAKIIEITLNDEYKLGIDWGVVSSQITRTLLMNDVDITVGTKFKLQSQGTLDPGFEVLIGKHGSGANYAVMIQALKTVGDTNILSSPRIIALNNEEAKILVGSSEPYATQTVTQGTSTTTTASNLTFLDIGVKLYVTPTINKDGFVTMKIKPEVSSRSDWYTYGSPETRVPIVSTTQAETNVMVKDGHTIIIAGLIRDERSGSVSKVPFFGDLPLIGGVFKKTDSTVAKKELVIFITPHIISGEIDYLEQPLTPPIGEGKFTVPEKPTFQRRKPIEMKPEYLKEKISEKKIKEIKKIDIEASSPEDYFYIVRNKILKNISIPKGDTKILKGDRVKVSFLLYSGGNLISKPKMIESTNDSFSKIAIKAVEKTAPFPAFPLSVKGSKKQFTLDIIYEPD